MSLLDLLCQQQAFLSLWAPQCSCHDLYTAAGSSFISTFTSSHWCFCLDVYTITSHCSGQEVNRMVENAGRVGIKDLRLFWYPYQHHHFSNFMLNFVCIDFLISVANHSTHFTACRSKPHNINWRGGELVRVLLKLSTIATNSAGLWWASSCAADGVFLAGPQRASPTNAKVCYWVTEWVMKLHDWLAERWSFLIGRYSFKMNRRER